MSRVESTSTSEAVGSIAAKRETIGSGFAHIGPRFAAPIVLVVLAVTFSILKPHTFATSDNATTIAQSQMVLLVIALGSLLPLIVGEFDLSVGYMACTSSFVAADLSSRHHSGAFVATIVALLVCLLVGIINAVLVVSVGISSFIATLGTGTVLGGYDLYISNGQTLFGNLPIYLTKIGTGDWLGIPIIVYLGLAFAIVVYYVLEWTPLGRLMYATGASQEAARLTGVATGSVRAGALVLAPLIAGCGGLLELGLVGSASVAVGPGFLLPALAACFLGTTTDERGRFNVFGTIVAIFLIAVGVTGLEQLGIPSWVELVFNGGALITAVALTVLGRRLRVRRSADQPV